MKNNMLKAFSAAVAALMISSSLNASAISTKMDYDVESGAEPVYIVETTNGLMSESLFDYAVEDSKDINQNLTVANGADSASLMADLIMFRGKGTEASPYLISTPEELLGIATWVNEGFYTESYFVLENDIDLSGAEWIPIGDYKNSELYNYAFKGNFDGNGKTVSNFKITEPQIYAGFFGLANNAVIKNLTIDNFSINIENAANYMYVGGIVARLRAIGDGEKAIIENCHVKNTNINAKSRVRIYGSGHSGYLHSSENADLEFSGCSTDATVNFRVNVSENDRSMIRAGGLIGYAGIVDGKMSVSDSYSNAKVITCVNDGSATSRNDIHAGGFAGDFSLSSASEETRSSLTIDSCYSTNMVYALAEGDTYTGGFSGYFVSSASDISITDCHTSSNVYARSMVNNSYIGGFASIAGIAPTDLLGTITVENVYASGNVIDNNSNDSCGGKFVGYIEGEPVFENLYVMADSILISKQGTTKGSKELKGDDIPGTALDKAAADDIRSYIGFDIDTWIAGTAPYSYPVLAENPFVSGKYNIYYLNDDDGLVAFKENLGYGDAPAVPDAPNDSIYVFSHWAMYKNGTDIMDGNTVLTGDIIIFPVFTNEYKSYNISFSANGEIFETTAFKYNSNVVMPENIPAKPADKLFRYVFSHWSLTENGPELTTKDYIVTSERTYYAVYKKAESGVWDGESSSPFTAGNGTAASPYEISDAFQLTHLSNIVNDGTAVQGAYYKITKDIDLGGHEWIPIGTSEHPFIGTVSGNGYCIYNFKITNESMLYAGLFGYIRNSEISELEVSGFEININNADKKLKYYAGALVAFADSKGINTVTKISECYADGKIAVVSKLAYTGGLAGAVYDDKHSTFFIENCVTNVDIAIDTASNSVAGGIAGEFKSQNQGISFINKCYAIGNISALSKVSTYGGGIVGFLYNDEDWIGEVSGILSDEEIIETGAVRNSFYKANYITLSIVTTSYAGAVYGWKNSAATVFNCGYVNSGLVITAKIVAQDEDISAYDNTLFASKDDVAAVFKFDFENIWDISGDLPVLKVFNQIKDVFRINEFAFDDSTDKLNVSIKSCFRDVENYIVMLGAYDERGKMIGFTSVLVTTPSEVATIGLEISKTNKALTATLSIVNPKTLALLEAPVTLVK